MQHLWNPNWGMPVYNINGKQLTGIGWFVKV